MTDPRRPGTPGIPGTRLPAPVREEGTVRGPQRHERPATPPEPSGEPQAAEVPRPARVPVERGPDPIATPSTFAQLAAAIDGGKTERWKLIGAAIAAGGALVASCSGGVVAVIQAARPHESATSAEVAKLQTELADARGALERSGLEGEIKALRKQMAAWQKEREQESATNRRQDRQIVLVAELVTQQNGGKPARDWPEPDPRRWFALNDSPTVRRTDQFWER